MSLELLLRVCMTFSRQNGLYFWSIVSTTGGIILYNTADILNQFKSNNSEVLLQILLNVGWGLMTTGFSLVLWSRLHLVTNNSRLLKLLLGVIIFNAIVWNALEIGIAFGAVLKDR